MPVFSLGGMRYQQSWKDLIPSDITEESQQNVVKTVEASIKVGFNHLETARHYGSSERQLGWAISGLKDHQRILQSKIPPRDDPEFFESELALSFESLGCTRIDLLAIHGINLQEHLEQTVKPGGCMDVVRRWQKDGRIGSVGFSTHGSVDLIIKTIKTDLFDYLNLHWYYINQDNEKALREASLRDMGVFIISPTDKGGHLHTPPQKLLELCTPLHPIVFNDLFCLNDPRVHTLSVGAACATDLDLHLEAVQLLPKADQLLPRITKKLEEASSQALGKDWVSTWQQGLPCWSETPGQINIPVLLRLHNLIESWGMVGYAKARYGLLGKAGHWFPGRNADCLDREVSEEALIHSLSASPWKDQIPAVLRRLRERFNGSTQERLSNG